MNMADDKAVFQRLHGIGKNVTADSLNNVFYKFGAVALDSAPFLGSINPHIGDTFSAELVHAYGFGKKRNKFGMAEKEDNSTKHS